MKYARFCLVWVMMLSMLIISSFVNRITSTTLLSTPLPGPKPTPLFIYAGHPYPKVLVGVASWYGHFEEGRPTASTEIFYPERFTAACRILPLRTFAIVTNLENGRRCIVWINDHGPYIKGRIIDVSVAVARHLKMHRKGLTQVRIRVMGENPDAVY